jgi:hypothetical protein
MFTKFRDEFATVRKSAGAVFGVGESVLVKTFYVKSEEPYYFQIESEERVLWTEKIVNFTPSIVKSYIYNALLPCGFGRIWITGEVNAVDTVTGVDPYIFSFFIQSTVNDKENILWVFDNIYSPATITEANNITVLSTGKVLEFILTTEAENHNRKYSFTVTFPNILKVKQDLQSLSCTQPIYFKTFYFEIFTG